MAEQRNCKQCSQQFEVTDDDLVFLDKISPEFNGQKYPISAPTFCPTCREIRRMLLRNERVIYKRKSDQSGVELTSIFAPDKTDYKVFAPKEWYSDSWNPMDYARDFDFSKSFFEQFDSLIHDVPRPANNLISVEMCDYCNQVRNSKNCYLCYNANECENCMYCSETHRAKNCVDCLDTQSCEFCFSCFDCAACNACQYLDHCKNCSQCYFTYDCSGCKNVMLCNGLHNQQYMFKNEQLTKEQYEAKLKEYDFGKRSVIESLKNEFVELKRNAIHNATNNINSENCTGDYLIDCSNCENCFNALKIENCKNVLNVEDKALESRELSFVASPELCYEGAMVVGYKNLFGMMVIDGNGNMYCQFCENCKDCFGCVGLRQKRYCIFNKQYTKEEFEALVPKIIEHMKTSGEWGEFFPASLSPYGYNETVAHIYHPKSKEEATAFGAKWQDNDYSLKFDGPFYEPKDDIKDYANNEPESDGLLKGILKCSVTGKAFKIMPQELAFYMEHNIPVPTKYAEARYMELFKLRNPRVLYERQCMCDQTDHGHDAVCQNKFKTTYAPDRPEKIYCEDCYLKTTIS